MFKWHFGFTKILNFWWFRIFTSIVFASIVIIAVDQLEVDCETEKKSCNPIDLILKVDNIESFGILTTAFLYALEGPGRRQKNIKEAWTIIDNAASSGNSTSNARIKALEYLKTRNQSLQKLNLEKAYLEGINLKGAELIEVRLCKSKLEFAHLHDADLSGADLSDANLKNAQIINANLCESNLENADLSDSN